MLLSSDVGAALLGWGAMGSIAGWPPSALPLRARGLLVLLAVSATLLALGWQRLYRSRVCAVRSVELRRLGRAVLAAAVITALTGQVLGLEAHLVAIAVSALLVLALLITSRSLYRSWVRRRRRQGRFVRRMVLVGANHEALLLADSLREHPESGVELCGFASSPEQARSSDSLGLPWLGPVNEMGTVLPQVGATGVLVVTNAITTAELDELARRLPASGYHVHVASGLHGIAPARLRPIEVGYEPMLYIEPMGLRTWQQRLKRALDLVVASIVMIPATPVLLLAAAAIKLEDGGPVLFTQPRVGLHNTTFRILKLRTMTVDAEARREGLAEQNQREGGPLFKVAHDPRVTRCGRLLRRTSIDELPQLINVLRGQMSLVGPRPALLAESAQFDRELQRRVAVKPGITGLWQVEARDNPAFGPYRRLDLYYVENWSVGLDLSILAATAFVVLGRTLSLLHLPWVPHSATSSGATLD